MRHTVSLIKILYEKTISTGLCRHHVNRIICANNAYKKEERKDLRNDVKDIKQDKKELKTDRKNGDKNAAKLERQDIKADRKDMKQDSKDLGIKHPVRHLRRHPRHH